MVNTKYSGLTKEEFIKLIHATKDPRYKIAFIFAYKSGVRISEITNLRQEDIDIENRIIHIRGNKKRITILPKGFKEKHLKYIPMGVTNRSLQRMFEKNLGKAGINKVIGHFKRKTKTKRGWIIKEIPIYKFNFHCLRHSFTFRALKKGVPLNEIQVLLGLKHIKGIMKSWHKANPVDAIQSVIDKGV